MSAALDRLWAGWRRSYIEVVSASEPEPGGCVFCSILASDGADGDGGGQVVWRDAVTAVLLNAYPYTSGHLLVMPVRHVGELEGLTAGEGAAVWSATSTAVRALKAAYSPDGLNVGANLGRSAGAGVPGHFHLHALPRWNGDTNFMTTVAEARVLPESLPDTYAKVRAAWPTTT